MATKNRTLAAVMVVSGLALAVTAGWAQPHDSGHGAEPKQAQPKPAATPVKTPPKEPGAKTAPEGKAEPKTESKTTKETPKAGEKPRSETEAKPEFKLDEQPKPAPRIEEFSEQMTSAKALELLKDGNVRWVTGTTRSPNTDATRRQMTAGGQKPFAAILTCADSRLPVERLFDRGVGDLFVVRVAGATAGASESGTIEYGAGHLHTPLIVVMGHTKCGAVAAACSGTEIKGAVAAVIEKVAPAVERAKRNNPDAKGDELAAAAVKENVWQSVYDLLKTSEEVRESAIRGEVKIVGAVCDISTGKVEWLGEHPWQAELIEALKSSKKEPAAAGVAAVKEGHE